MKLVAENPSDPRLDELYYNAVDPLRAAPRLSAWRSRRGSSSSRRCRSRRWRRSRSSSSGAPTRTSPPTRTRPSSTRSSPASTRARRASRARTGHRRLDGALHRGLLPPRPGRDRQVDRRHQRLHPHLRHAARVRRQGGRRVLRPVPDLRGAGHSDKLEKHLRDYLKQWGTKGGVDREIIANVKLGEMKWKDSCPVEGVNGACVEIIRVRASSATKVAEATRRRRARRARR